MRTISIALWVLVYIGGVVGTTEFLQRRFSCRIFSVSNDRCGASVLLNVATWPFEVGKEIAIWSFEQEDRRNKAQWAGSSWAGS
jgi:hypothetical protein